MTRVSDHIGLKVPLLIVGLVLVCQGSVVLAALNRSRSDNQHHRGTAEAGGGATAAEESLSLFGLPNGGFWGGFGRSLGMIIATEIGDKTFFIAAIMAMTHRRILIFSGAISALIVMTVLSAALGFGLPTFLPREYTHFFSALLFLYFGAKMLKEGFEAHGGGPSEELAEVEEELVKKKEGGDIEAGGSYQNFQKSASKVFSQAFTMTFLAEWGDRSQIATIVLAAAQDVYGVTLGGIVGHSLCTGLAVIGGRMLAARISERTVHLFGGALFIVFGLHALIYGG